MKFSSGVRVWWTDKLVEVGDVESKVKTHLMKLMSDFLGFLRFTALLVYSSYFVDKCFVCRPETTSTLPAV